MFLLLKYLAWDLRMLEVDNILLPFTALSHTHSISTPRECTPKNNKRNKKMISTVFSIDMAPNSNEKNDLRKK